MQVLKPSLGLTRYLSKVIHILKKKTQIHRTLFPIFFFIPPKNYQSNTFISNHIKQILK